MSESRVLEDQLYEADYENRVLRDQLEQYRRKVAEARIPTPSVIRPHDHPEPYGPDSPSDHNSAHRIPTPYADPQADLPEFDLGEGLETDEYDLPMFDEGEPVDTDALTDPEAIDAPKPDAKSSKSTRSLDKPNSKTNPFEDDFSDAELLPAPGGPMPPGKNDTLVPPIEPGEVLPPPMGNQDEKPPGQIMLPDAIQAQMGVPEKLQIHPTLSVPHHTDGVVDGAVIVVNAIDAAGRPVDITNFDIDAELSIVVLDPSRPADAANIGRWDFTRGQVQTLIRQHPVVGLHVPIQWQDERPNGEDVIVHVRLRGEDEDMKCESELRLADQSPITDWTPRAKTLR
ncbi:hypothetical protein [Rubripirellula tenax]|nr:hypothetical protein [Rubripirellula tenax]